MPNKTPFYTLHASITWMRRFCFSNSVLLSMLFKLRTTWVQTPHLLVSDTTIKIKFIDKIFIKMQHINARMKNIYTPTKPIKRIASKLIDY